MIGKGYKANNKYGVALLFTGLALLSFFYISFLGLGYLLEGFFDSEDLSSLMPSFMSEADPLLVLYATISLVYLILVCVMLYVMCSSKSKRNKRKGRPVEIVSGLITFILLVIGCVPFMKFLSIIENKSSLLDDVANMRKSALDVDADYLNYVKKRVDCFIKNGNKYYGSNTKATAKSLKRRLIPLNNKKIRKEREIWLEEMADVSIWNPCTAHNVKAIMKASETWTKEYSELSSLRYKHERSTSGEPYPSFEHKSSASNRDKWIEEFKKIEIPDRRAWAALGIVVIMIFSLYRSIERPHNIISGTHQES